jgi:hypothetical protein
MPSVKAHIRVSRDGSVSTTLDAPLPPGDYVVSVSMPANDGAKSGIELPSIAGWGPTPPDQLRREVLYGRDDG